MVRLVLVKEEYNISSSTLALLGKVFFNEKINSILPKGSSRQSYFTGKYTGLLFD